MYNEIKKAAEYIKEKIDVTPEIGLILGSGLGVIADKVENPISIKYSDIPGFPESTVKGHAGELVAGKYMGKNVIVMKGRFHFYEGHSQRLIAMPVRVMKELGVETLIVTNAAGGVNRDFKAGNLMLIKDHINFSGSNPLIGENDDKIGPRFPDMSDAYNSEYRKTVKNIAERIGMDLKEGVYMFFSGPNYETPAEVKMAGIMGADAVGMSTVPEVITAVHCGIKVIGISCISNMAAGILDEKLNHEDVIEVTNRIKSDFINLVSEIVSEI
ncbi:purine-nucleoside phosphorylase [Peptacetobacter hominis]|uniref:Purine nucleoside phosphorylase n=1 Tax=Peptacetobacter hominis TaxID=2743610 RepID=A0A544QYZ9_9FIRM|nr:purine-nucleoside phosphorylase [Peptacetobacter hominis]TQQ85855.1 purine-nucleoside phosphorylase [Peptacetobacter hominis]